MSSGEAKRSPGLGVVRSSPSPEGWVRDMTFLSQFTLLEFHLRSIENHLKRKYSLPNDAIQALCGARGFECMFRDSSSSDSTRFRRSFAEPLRRLWAGYFPYICPDLRGRQGKSMSTTCRESRVWFHRYEKAKHGTLKLYPS